MLLASLFSLAGYDVRIVDRTLGPGGGSIISRANGTSSYVATFNPAWISLPDNPGGGLFVRVTDTQLAADAAAAPGVLGAGRRARALRVVAQRDELLPLAGGDHGEAVSPSHGGRVGVGGAGE